MAERQERSDIIKIPRARASRQTEEQSGRYSYQQTTTSKPRLPELNDDNEDAWTMPKTRTSTIDYRNRTRDMSNPKRTQLVKQRRPFVGRLLIIVGLGLMMVILGVLALQALGNWWQRHTDDVTYGFPRTFQTDQYVGHGDSQTNPDHFIAINLNGTVIVLEVNAQHPQLDKSYYVTTGTDPLKPVTLAFPTINGKQYMYVTIGDLNAAYTVAFVNNGTQFTGVQH